MDDATEEALAHPQPGDVFQEMYAFWVFVLRVDDEHVTALTHGWHPNTALEQGTVEQWTLSEFSRVFHYDTIPGTWVRLDQRRNHRVLAWWPLIETEIATGQRAVKIHRPPPVAESVMWLSTPGWPRGRGPDPWRPLKAKRFAKNEGRK